MLWGRFVVADWEERGGWGEGEKESESDQSDEMNDEPPEVL